MKFLRQGDCSGFRIAISEKLRLFRFSAASKSSRSADAMADSTISADGDTSFISFFLRRHDPFQASHNESG